MAKVTWIMQQYGRAEGRIGLDDTRVYVQHPDDPSQILEMPHPTQEAARATFKTVVTKFFNSRQGWKVWLKQEDHLDVESWRPKPVVEPTEAEQAALHAAARSRSLGWIIDGTTMVFSLKRQMRQGDLEIALVDNGQAITSLHVLISVDDDDGIGRARFFERLATDGVPKLEVLTLESPWESRAELARLPMTGLTELLEKRPLRELAVIGDFDLPSPRAMQSLERLRLHNESISPAELANIGEAPKLRVLHLAAGRANTRIRKAFPRLPFAQLDELALVGVDNIDETLEALLATSTGRLPRAVHLQGEPGPALETAIEHWRRAAPDSTLTFGEAAAGIPQGVSPFSAEARDPALRAMWDPMR